LSGGRENAAVVGIVRVALERPYTFVVAAILALLVGTMAGIRTPKDIFPNIGIPVISVVWNYAGLPPDDMSGRIVYIFERGLTTTVNDIEHIESQSVPGYGIVKIFFQPHVDIAAAEAQVTAIAQTQLKQLPPGVTPPLLVIFNASSVPILQLALSSPKASQTELNDLASNFVRPPLTTVAGAALPAPYGGMIRQVQIDLDQRSLHSYGLSALDVVNALSVQNLITPAGTQKIGTYEYTVNLNGSPRTVAEFNELPIKVVNGAMVYVRDVAFAHDGSPPQTNVVQLDGKKGVLMTVLKAGSASTLDIIAGIKELLPRVQETLPPGVELKIVNDQSGFVKASVFSVIREGVIAAALTGLMILLFLGSWRSTLIISISIPLSILAALPVLAALGETINVMTLGGFALAVGMLVDEATVTIENINWHLEQGKEIKTAILDGAAQIVVAATLSLLCICIAFVPMFGLGGVAGYLFRPLAEAVVFAMIASYLWSRTLVPTMAYYLLRNQTHHGHGDGGGGPARRLNFAQRFQQAFERGFERLRTSYVELLRLAVAHRRIAVTLFLLLPLVSFLLIPHLGQNFFPDVESNAIKLHVRAHPGTRVEEVTRLVNEVEDEIRTVIPPNEIASTVDNIGLPNSGINMSYNNSGTIGIIDVDILIALEGDDLPTADYIKTLREVLPRKFPAATFSFLPADMVSQILNFGAPAPIDVQITGPNMVENRSLAADLLAKINRVPGIADARIQQAFQAPALNVEFNRVMAGTVGLTEHDAATTMQNTLAGSSQTTPTYWLNPANGVSYAVSVQTPQYRIDTLEGLRTMPVATPGRPNQLLGGLATMQPGPESAVVTHYNIRPAIDIFATTQGRDLGGVTADVQKILDESRPGWGKGVRVVIRGQVATMESAYRELLFGLAVAIVLIYLLIVVNFQSWLDPFIIIMALPNALAGIVWMLFVTGTTLSVPALTGAIMCMGVATANSILVISFARERLAAGVDSVTAAIEAGGTRLRPVMMTALAMIIGMVPMALESGQNAPLGRAVIGGLVFATCATLFFVPTLFSIFHRRESLNVHSDEAQIAAPASAYSE
jgi:multidrug efflux pump subunit AcrB